MQAFNMKHAKRNKLILNESKCVQILKNSDLTNKGDT